MSINVGPLEGGKHRCELNNATDENQFTLFLENQETFTYLAITEVIFTSIEQKAEFFKNMLDLYSRCRRLVVSSICCVDHT